jgi:hypothetical protein
MTAPVRAEWLKLVTTRTFRGTWVGAAAVGLVVAIVGTAQGPPPWDASQPLHAGTAWGLGVLAVTLLAVVVGSMTVTEEFAHDTIAHTFLADPGRVRSLVAKAVVAALASVAIAAVAAALLAATVYGLAAMTGGALALFASDVKALLGLFVAAGAMGVIGVGAGALVRQPVATLVGVLLWLFVAENLLGVLAGPVAGFMPGKLAVALSGVPQGASGVPEAVAAGALVAYAVALTAAGAFEMRRRDVL